MHKRSEPDNQHVSNSAFAGGGEIGTLIRAFDWSKTPVGPVSQWPQSLRTAVRIILNSRYPMFVWWGRELVNLYNDPYRAFLGIKHPGALGKSAREVWAEIWEQIGPRTDAVLLHGESTFDEGLLLLMERHGYLEETYFTFSYSPAPDDNGNIGGIFCAVTEDTQRVIGERRLKLLREIAAATSQCRTPKLVCEAAAQCLVQARRDLPFSLIYLLDDIGKTLRRVAHAGIAGDHSAAPPAIALEPGAVAVWPLRRVMDHGETVLVDKLSELFPDLPLGEWGQPPDCAVLLPIAHQGQKRPAGVLVAGLNPHRRFGEEFRGFVSLLSNQIAGAIANAVAYETERRRAEELAELDRAKTLFFSNVSHEFRTPLTLTLGPLEEVLAEARERLSPESQEQLINARRNALRLLKLVNTLLDFSRIEAGRVQAVYQPTDLGRLTAEIASVFRSAMERAGLRFTVECESSEEPIYVDHDMWEKVVLNLLSNAFKFTFEGEIAIMLKPVDGSVEMAVRDTGIGIPEQERERVFERFHRIENTRARTYEGTGIGLALVQELIRMHGGSVRVESEPGKGSSFTVSIPRGRAHLPADHIHSGREPALTGLRAEAYVGEAEPWLPRESAAATDPTATTVPSTPASAEDTAPQRDLILIADDNADMRAYLTHLLRNHYRVHTVNDGVQAVQAARELRPDLLLSDVMMPALDGFGLLSALRSDPVLSGMPVILLSARAGEESRVEGLQAGADDYLVKPFTARELLARVSTHVQVAKLRRESERRRRLYDTILSNTPDLAYVFDLNHRFTYANKALLTMWGKTWEEAIGKNCFELGYPEWHAAMHDREIEQVIATRQPIRGEVPFTGTNGRRIYDYIFVPVLGPNGEVEAIAGTTRDITEHKQAEEALMRSEKLATAGRLAATIAHEINNPLEAVTNLVFLARHSTAQAEIRSYLDRAEEELARVSQLTRQTLGFYRETEVTNKVRVGAIVISLLGVFASRARNKSIGTWPEIKDDREIRAIPGELRQLIANLINNSIAAVDTGGRIRIRVKPATAWDAARTEGVRLTIGDNGQGIPAAIRAQLFEPFVSGNKDVGTGLGLWVCKTVVEKHAGTIRVKTSTKPGRSWTVFSIFLPANSEPADLTEALKVAV